MGKLLSALLFVACIATPTLASARDWDGWRDGDRIGGNGATIGMIAIGGATAGIIIATGGIAAGATGGGTAGIVIMAIAMRSATSFAAPTGIITAIRSGSAIAADAIGAFRLA
jgi:hypothetical protein